MIVFLDKNFSKWADLKDNFKEENPTSWLDRHWNYAGGGKDLEDINDAKKQIKKLLDELDALEAEMTATNALRDSASNEYFEKARKGLQEAIKGNISTEELKKQLDKASKEINSRINNVGKSNNIGIKLADKTTSFNKLREKIEGMENKFRDKVWENKRNIVLGGTGLALLGLIVGKSIYDSKKNKE